MYREGTCRPHVRLKSSIRFDEECGEGKRQENNAANDCYYGNKTRRQDFSHDAGKPTWMKGGKYAVTLFVTITIKTKKRREFYPFWQISSGRSFSLQPQPGLCTDSVPGCHLPPLQMDPGKFSDGKLLFITHTKNTPKDKCHLFVCGLKGSRDVISLALVRPDGEVQAWPTPSET